MAVLAHPSALQRGRVQGRLVHCRGVLQVYSTVQSKAHVESAVQCSAMQCSAVQCSVLQCRKVERPNVECNAGGAITPATSHLTEEEAEKSVGDKSVEWSVEQC